MGFYRLQKMPIFSIFDQFENAWLLEAVAAQPLNPHELIRVSVKTSCPYLLCGTLCDQVFGHNWLANVGRLSAGQICWPPVDIVLHSQAKASSYMMQEKWW